MFKLYATLNILLMKSLSGLQTVRSVLILLVYNTVTHTHTLVVDHYETSSSLSVAAPLLLNHILSFVSFYFDVY